MTCLLFCCFESGLWRTNYSLESITIDFTWLFTPYVVTSKDIFFNFFFFLVLGMELSFLYMPGKALSLNLAFWDRVLLGN